MQLQRFILVVLACAVLAGCKNLVSDVPLSEGFAYETPLPKEFALAETKDGQVDVLLTGRWIEASRAYELSMPTGDGGVANINAHFVSISDSTYWIEAQFDGSDRYLHFRAKIAGQAFDLASNQLPEERVFTEAEPLIAALLDLRDSDTTQLEVLDFAVPGNREIARARFAQQLEEAAREQAERAAEAAAEAALEANRPQQQGRWYYQETVDAMTDDKIGYIYGFPNDVDVSSDAPFIRFSCQSSRRGVMISWKRPLRDLYPSGDVDLARVTIRHGGLMPQEYAWATSDDWATTFPPDALSGSIAQLGTSILNLIIPGIPASEVNSVFGADTIHAMFKTSRDHPVVVRAYPRSGQSVTLVFDVAGFEEVSYNFPRACR